MSSQDIGATNESESLAWKDFSAQLKILWEKDGAIKESLNLIDSHPYHRKNQGRTGRRQILRALGEDRLLSGDVLIPERADSPVYKPNPNRVMYCVYSTPVFNSNGYSTRSRGVAAGLRDAGADVVVVARAGYPWDWQIDTLMPAQTRMVSKLDEIDYVHLPNGSMSALSPSAHIELAAEAFVQEALIQRPSFIQSASNYRVALPALIAARRLGIPFIYEVRGLWEITGASNKPGFEDTDRYAAMRDHESRVARSADHVFAITRQVKDELVSRGVEASKITLAPNAVDPSKFQPAQPTASMARSLGLQPGIPVIGFAGSIVKYEGLLTLLEASRILVKRGVKHQLALAGSGNTEPALKKYAEKNEMNWVHFLGRIPQDQVPTLLCVSDIIVTPRDSTVITELVSALKPLEAFSAGRAVVLSDVAPNIDLAGDGESRAKLFEAGNPSAFADTIEELISNPKMRVQLGRTARKWIESERNWHSIGSSIFSQLNSLSQENIKSDRVKLGLEDLKVGVFEEGGFTPILREYTSVEFVSGPNFERRNLRDLDFVIVNLSESENYENLQTRITDPLVQEVLEQCEHLGIPRVGLVPRGLNDSNFQPEDAHLLDVCLSGEFDGVVEFLEDPRTYKLRVGGLSPIVVPRAADRLNAVESTDGFTWIAGMSGVKKQSTAELLSLLGTEQSEPEGAEKTVDISDTITKSILPFAIYISRETPKWLQRELITGYGLDVPLIWEEQHEPSRWFGSTFAEGVSLFEFIAGCHHWEADPELRLNLVNYQKIQLENFYSFETQLIILCRSLGIPVSSTSDGISEAELHADWSLRSDFWEKSLSKFLQEKADDLAPMLQLKFRGVGTQN